MKYLRPPPPFFPLIYFKYILLALYLNIIIMTLTGPSKAGSRSQTSQSQSCRCRRAGRRLPGPTAWSSRGRARSWSWSAAGLSTGWSGSCSIDRSRLENTWIPKKRCFGTFALPILFETFWGNVYKPQWMTSASIGA